MGIKNLSKFLRDKCPNIFRSTNISEFAFKKIAIDVSLYLCNYKVIFGDEWMFAFINLVACLRRNDVHCVFVYDSRPLPDKDEERKIRWEQRMKQEEKINELYMAMEEYVNTGVADPILLAFQDKKGLGSKSLLGNNTVQLNINQIGANVWKMKRQMFAITKEDYDLTKEIFNILGIQYLIAPYEAETLCADLALRGIVDYVLTEDTDLLAYGCSFINKFDVRDGSCNFVDFKEVLSELDLNQEQFLDFCIMCSCDYNKNLFRLGPVKAYNAMLEYGNIDKFAEETGTDVSILRHVRVRSLFNFTNEEYLKVKHKVDRIRVKYCDFPDFQKLYDLLLKLSEQINAKIFNHNRTKQSFEPNIRRYLNIDIDELRKSFIRVLTFED